MGAPVASAREYWVAVTGDDRNPGTAALPFANPQQALDLAQPGDRISVRPGVYYGRFVVRRSGTADKPIIFEGAPGAILDGGDRFAGWEPAAEVGPGVYRTRAIAYHAALVSWNNRMILNFGSGYEYSDQFALDTLKKPPTDPHWDGIEAHYLWRNGTTYIRCRLGDKPDERSFAFAPFGSAVVRVDHQSHVVIRGFRLRNAHWCIALTGADDCIVEDNYVSAFGKAGIVVEKGAARNHIRNNECTQDYIYADFGHPWNSPVDRHMWKVWKDYCYGDRMGIRLHEDYGPDNHVYGNHVFRTFDGICSKDGAPGLYIYSNIVENVADDGLNSSGTANNAEWHDNLVIEGGNGCITIDGYPQFQGPLYVYRNRLHHTQTENKGGGIHFKNAFPETAHIYVYHNSVSGNHASVSANNWSSRLSSLPGVTLARHLYFFNNIFSSADFCSGPDFWKGKGIGSYDYNWVGGKNTQPWVGLPNFGRHNLVADGNLMWTPPTRPGFLLTVDSPGRHAGADLSKPFHALGRTFPALPGMKPGYFAGAAPDLGALQHGENGTPAAPANVRAVAKSADRVDVSWTNRADNVTAFLIDRSGDGAVYTTIARAPAGATTCTDFAPGLEPGKKYWYRVRAANFNGAWLSEPSNVAEVMVPAAR